MLGNNGDIDILQCPAETGHLLDSMTENIGGLDSLACGITRWKGIADIRQAGRSEDGVGDRVEQAIGIGVSVKSRDPGKMHPSEDEFPMRIAGKAMNIVAVSNARAIS